MKMRGKRHISPLLCFDAAGTDAYMNHIVFRGFSCYAPY